MPQEQMTLLFRHLFPLAVVPLLCAGSVSGQALRISNADEFLEFVNSLGEGTSYSGETVYLDSDITLSKVITPIGNSSYAQFQGTFDGQGYVISNLTTEQHFQHSGLFGYSEGLTVRNVVLGDSCSISSSYDGEIEIGGVVGACFAKSSPCIIENAINIGTVVCTGKSGVFLYVGGIIGYASSSKDYEIRIKNCANYGPVSLSDGDFNSDVGGVVGRVHLGGENYQATHIQNCLNYGTITVSGSQKTLFIGGIAGLVAKVTLENSLSAGKIASETGKIGGIFGNADSDSNITHSFWTKEVGTSSSCGSGSPAIDRKSAKIEINKEYAYKMNLYSDVQSWNGWILNTDALPVSFRVNAKKGFTVKTQIILLPDPAPNNDRAFSDWFSDREMTAPFVASEVKAPTTLYGMFCRPNYIVALDVNGGDPASIPSSHPMAVACSGYYETLPIPARTGYNFEGWFTEQEGGRHVFSGDEVASQSNHSLYAQWTVIDYTLTFDFNDNGTLLVETHRYNEKIVYPNPQRDGYTLLGWRPKPDLMPAKDLTVTAQWKRNINTSFIVGIAVPIVVVVLAIIVVVFFLKKDKVRDYEGGIQTPLIINGEPGNGLNNDDIDENDNKNYFRAVADTKDDMYDSKVPYGIESVLECIYTPDYVRPAMCEALLGAGIPEEKVGLVCSACEKAAHRAAEGGRLVEGLTEEDAAAVAMYTYDFGSDDFEINPYRIINRSLVGRNYAGLQKAGGLLYLVMTALRKLPRTSGRVLYRGVRGEVNLDEDHYTKGNVVTWTALSSTSPDVDATKAFLAKGSKSGKATGTLFIIDGGWGYNTQPYSLFPGEEEILLEPERQFRVKSVICADLTVINLEMLKTPVVLPRVFGEGKGKGSK